MAELMFYTAVPSRGAVVRWMLEEIGEPYEIKLLRLSDGDQRKPDYLAINPMGKVPALKHGDTVITEVAAICAYLADEFPGVGLNVPVGNTRRGLYFQWLFYGPGVLEPAMTDRAFPRKEQPPATALGYRELDVVLDVVAKPLASNPYLMGSRFTAADIVLGSGLRFATTFKLIPERPLFSDYFSRLITRPAFRRAEAKDKELGSK